MRPQITNRDPVALALDALVWTLEAPDRAARLIALTGLTPDQLRTGASKPTTLVAILDFLEAHEPDLIACAGAIGVAPKALIDARRDLENA